MENIVLLAALLDDIPFQLNFECGVRNHFCAVYGIGINLCHDCGKEQIEFLPSANEM